MQAPATTHVRVALFVGAAVFFAACAASEGRQAKTTDATMSMPSRVDETSDEPVTPPTARSESVSDTAVASQGTAGRPRSRAEVAGAPAAAAHAADIAASGTSGRAGGAAGVSGASAVSTTSTPAGTDRQGSAGEPAGVFAPAFILGADISSVHEHDYSFVDVDGESKSVFDLLKNHGFNYVRIKTFVEPNAAHGYASTVGGCEGLPEPFSDRDHVIAFGKQVKAAGMGLLLDFHYSDVWADPGKQHIPEAWRDAASIEELAARLSAYTRDVLTTAIAAGARPDMVQVGNEITPGMLMHVPGPNTDCWGNQPEPARISGSAANWDNFASLLRAGIEAVREVDREIQVVLHIENTDDLRGAMGWVGQAVQRELDFDVLALSCYEAFQGQPEVWEATFRALADAYPKLKFAIAEYNPQRTRANLIMRELPDGRGLGTFLWEPTRSGSWGSALFSEQGNTMRANPSDFEEFDRLLPMLGL